MDKRRRVSEPKVSRVMLNDVGRRIGAYYVDVALIVVFFVVTQTFLRTPLRILLGDAWMKSGLLLELYVLATVSVPAWLYFAFSDSSPRQATVGKRLWGLIVTDMAGKRIAFSQALARTVIKLLPWELAHLIANVPTSMWIDPQSGALSWDVLVSPFRYSLFGIVYLLLGLYLVTMLLRTDRRSVHDLLTGTTVTRP